VGSKPTLSLKIQNLAVQLSSKLWWAGSLFSGLLSANVAILFSICGFTTGLEGIILNSIPIISTLVLVESIVETGKR
jgi:hypothetical protein